MKVNDKPGPRGARLADFMRSISATADRIERIARTCDASVFEAYFDLRTRRFLAKHQISSFADLVMWAPSTSMLAAMTKTDRRVVYQVAARSMCVSVDRSEGYGAAMLNLPIVWAAIRANWTGRSAVYVTHAAFERSIVADHETVGEQ